MNQDEVFKIAKQGIKKLPKCAVEGCENNAFVLLQGQFVCGDCCIRFQEHKKRMMKDIFKNIKKSGGNVGETKR